MTKIDIYSGFLGAGKTTLIKKMISEGYKGEKLVLIENEFGEIGIDGGFLQEAGINITEMNSGCICCSLVGDFGRALTQVIDEYHPDRIIIEPSGVGKLSDVIGAVEKVTCEDVQLGSTVAVVDANKVKVYMKNFGEFYNNQVETAACIILSRTDSVPQKKLDTAVSMLKEHNPNATIVTTPWCELTGEQLKEAMEGGATIAKIIAEMKAAQHHHHHHEHDEHCTCGCHDHDHDHDHHHEHHHHDHDHEHHHHDHDEHCDCGCHDHEHDHEHHHHHEHDEHCTCGCHDHDHHHHHADEVFTSWGTETHKKFTMDFVRDALEELDLGTYGMVLRAKGILAAEDGSWIHFDFVPGEMNLRTGSADTTGKLCVIGSKLDEHGIQYLFGL
ncbi:MAG: GTP-binding protein [Oscillospiraceae bacterium]|nr:GTP-binding protein [Oscillospiraceae bacterium]